MKEWFKARNIWGAAILSLSDAEAGRLAKALWSYTMSGEQQNLSGAEKGIFAIIQMTLSQDDIRESEISAKRAIAGSKGGNQKVANVAIASFATNDVANVANATNKSIEKEEDKEKELFLKREKEKAIAEKFDRFWSAYPRHQDKKKAQDAFRAINPDEELLAKMLASIEKQKASSQWQEAGGKFVPHPTTWLHGKRWEDEVQQDTGTGKPQKQSTLLPAQQYSQRDYSEPMETAEEWMLRMMAEEEAKKAGTAITTKSQRR